MSASGERQRAPGTVGCPRPRVQVTWTNERAAHGVTQTGNHWQSALATKEILQRKRRLCVKPPSASARPSASDAKADAGLCASPVPSSLSSNPPPSPFSSYLFSVYCWGNKRLHREAAPSRRLDGYQNSSLQKRPTDPRSKDRANNATKEKGHTQATHSGR